ncbi:MAG: hypothetical protein WCC87_10320 [Candidatus Korobacteraceae bacterium]
MAISVANAQQGIALPIAYGRVRATGAQIINQTDVLLQWQAGTAYSVGDAVTDGTYQQTCVTGGFSGSSTPSWSPTLGDFTSDGGVTWVNAGSSNGDGTQYGFWILGEGEWDGFETIWNQTAPLFAIGYYYDISSGAYTAWGPNPPEIHFHSGTDGPLGSSLPSPSSNGPDQGCDNWIGELPSGAAILPQCYSRMAYYALKWLPESWTYLDAQVNQVGQTLSPIGDWRALRCRIFDATGTQVGYEWTTNPAWHWVDAWIRCAFMPRSEYTLSMSSGPPYTTTPETLPSDVLDKFDWGSVYQFSQDCDYVLANGRKRFEGNYAFAQQTTLAAILEQILLNSRGYQQEYAGRLFLNMDKPRASVFLLTSAHQVPLTFTVDDREVHQNANDYTSEFLDLLVPAIGEIASIDFVYPGPPPYTDGQATIVTVAPNPVSSWDVIEIGGNSNPELNCFWLMNNILDPYTFTAQPMSSPMTSSQTGTGGYFGYPQSRFSKRTPELWHETHAVARGQIGPNNPSVQRSKRVPLTLDFASTTWDQQNRLTMYELYRSCGLDPANAFLQSLFGWLAGSPWDPPVTITVTVWSEAVDDSWNVLKSVMRGQRITIDPSVSVEWAGDYEVMETTYNPFQGDASQFSTEGGGDPSTVIGSSVLATPADQNAGTIVLVLRTYNENVFFDTSQTPSYVDLPGPILGDPES